jgi:hypothetical protein
MNRTVIRADRHPAIKMTISAATLTGLILIASGRAIDFLPDYGGPDGDGDADDVIVHAATNGHAAVYGGSMMPDAGAGIAVALAVLLIAGAVAIHRTRKGKPAAWQLAGGAMTAMLALLVVPESLTPALPKIGIMLVVAAALGAVSWAIRKCVRRSPAPKPAQAARARAGAAWPAWAPVIPPGVLRPEVREGAAKAAPAGILTQVREAVRKRA